MEDIASIEALLATYAPRPEAFMWFLGAGTSRTAGMPTAADLIWDLKFSRYGRAENQSVRFQDISNHVLRARVQSYFDSRGAPAASDPKEYPFYFEMAFAGLHPVWMTPA
jgi:hypothetical protein